MNIEIVHVLYRGVQYRLYENNYYIKRESLISQSFVKWRTYSHKKGTVSCSLGLIQHLSLVIFSHRHLGATEYENLSAKKDFEL